MKNELQIRKCPRCQSEININATKCLHCHANLWLDSVQHKPIWYKIVWAISIAVIAITFLNLMESGLF